MATDPSNLVEARSLHKRYPDGAVHALKGVSLALRKGLIYALQGRSGCGKSTLLHLIGQLDTPDRGELLYQGKVIDRKSVDSRFRRNFFGFVFQSHHLIPVLTLCENVEAALIHERGLSSAQRREKAESRLREMGLEQRINARAARVSGGERQRAAIARALANAPLLVLADEPTGNVDSNTAGAILQHLSDYVANGQSSILVATHDPQVSAIANVILHMDDGVIVSVEEKTGAHHGL